MLNASGSDVKKSCENHVYTCTMVVDALAFSVTRSSGFTELILWEK